MYCSRVHTSMVDGAMLYFGGPMFLVDYSLAQLFVSSRLSVLTTYVYSCHASLTVMPVSVYVYRFACCNVCSL